MVRSLMKVPRPERCRSKGWWIADVIGLLCIALVSFLVGRALFEPGVRYRIKPRRIPIEAAEFLRLFGALCDAQVHACDAVEVLDNGENFYQAELAAIANAKETIYLEAYILERGKIGSEFIDALSERARNGVRAKVVLDAVAAFSRQTVTFNRFAMLAARSLDFSRCG